MNNAMSLTAVARKEWADSVIQRIQQLMAGITSNVIQSEKELLELKAEERALRRIQADVESRLAEIRKELADILFSHDCTQGAESGCAVCAIIHS